MSVDARIGAAQVPLRHRDAEWTRTLVPPLQPSDLTRARLLDRLTAALDESAAVTLVSAPAGSGKTRMLTQWAHRLAARGDTHVAWLSVERWDANLDLLHAAVSQLGDPALAEPLARIPNVASPARARLLAQALGVVSRRIVVVVDDVHAIAAPGLGEALVAFVRASPGNVHVVLSGRALSALPLARVRVDGVALEIAPADLAFTADEVVEFFATRESPIAELDVASILERTEGWATGLRLMELSSGDGFALVRGDSPHVSDYFVEEVFADLAEDLRDFLVRTSVPETFTVELAQVLGERADAAAVIDLIEHRGILFERRSADPVWYRYHPLLRQFLRDQLVRDGQGRLECLERLTAEWFAAREAYLPALRHAVRAGDATAVAAVLRRCGLHLVLTGHAADVVDALREAPQPMRDAPAVRLLLAAAELALGDESPAAVVLEALERLPEAASAPERLLRAGLELSTAVRRGGMEEALARLEAAGVAPSGEPELDEYVDLQAAMGELYLGRLDLAEEWARRAVDHAREGGLVAPELRALDLLSMIALFRGQFDMVMDRGVRLEERWEALGRPEGIVLGATAAWRAWVHVERLESAAAGAELARARSTSGDQAAVRLARLADGVSALLEAETAADPRSAALRLVEMLAPRRDVPLPAAWIALAGPPVVHLLGRLGQPELRDEFIASVEGALPPMPETVVMRAVAALADGDADRARAAIGRVLRRRGRAALPTTLVQIRLLEAALDVQDGHKPEAIAALQRALAIAASERHLRPFLDAGPLVHRLLEDPGLRPAGFAAEIRHALARAGVVVSAALTPRELAVLRAIARDETLRTIATGEYVSMNTVKTHVRNVYRKLGASNRTEAIAAARALGHL